MVPTGFGWLGNKGQIKEEMGTHLWITARMLHVYSVAASMGRPGAYDLVDHGIKAMNGALRDKKYGGWYACVNDQAWWMPLSRVINTSSPAGRGQRRHDRAS